MTTASEILLDIKANYAILTLNRPEKLNAFNESMHQAFNNALDVIENNPKINAVLITGAGRGFCAGQDLTARAPQATAYDLGATLERFYNPLMARLYNLNIPKICAVNGVAAGAGVSLALIADVVFAARNAKFAMAFGKIGLVPDSGLSWLLPRLVGIAKAKTMLLTNATITAEQAYEYGMISAMIENEQLISHAEQFTATLSQNSKIANQLTLQTLNNSTNNNFSQQLEIEKQAQRNAGYSPQYQEGVAAFLAKRPADFTKHN